MKIKNVVIDTTEMSYEDVDNLVQKLRKVRDRKAELRNRLEHFRAMITNMRDNEGMALVSNNEGMTFVSKCTGEVLNPNDWELFDEITHSFYHEKGDE